MSVKTTNTLPPDFRVLLQKFQNLSRAVHTPAKKRIVPGILAGIIVLAALALISPGIAIGRPFVAVSTGTNAIGMVCTEDAGNPNPVFNLQARSGYVQTPDGNSVFMWSYALDPGPFQMPGPVLCVNEGDSVTINLTNNLPDPPGAALPENTSIIFPGQTGVSTSGGVPGLLTAEAAPSGGTVTYTFVADEPGTYLYESGTDRHKQIHMGLYGALVVRPALNDGTHFYAYNDPSTEYDPGREFILILHEFDPNLHKNVERGRLYNVTQRHDRYWTVNGRSLPDSLNDNFVPWLPNQPYGALVWVQAVDLETNPNALPALIRYANAGTVNHPFHPHGNHLKVIAQDGRFLGNAGYETFTRTIAAGQTVDLLFRWVNVENWTPGSAGSIEQVGQLPGINDVIYKDGVTFFSGDPDLGQTGDLPVGVTTYNQCGEFYYPWHSHALNEFQNFDEGFGGLATLVRVDPPGGCP
jgi:FtsP/CotA-like multicopper oxidase with cupredoxin domain